MNSHVISRTLLNIVYVAIVTWLLYDLVCTFIDFFNLNHTESYFEEAESNVALSQEVVFIC